MKDSIEQDKSIVAALDTEYQLAVENNDVETMGRILADDFILALGDGTVITRDELLTSAKNKDVIYEYQDDSKQTVRIWGDTAIITALLRSKGTENGKPFEHKLWFSDVYVRTQSGWRYAFGQASLKLPKE
ncbi:MAG: nuclear transport factor 2 family protein [Anaerolineales bacterium]|nr:nuclear transport factor 2 family protein [Anaerolineales bacterium]